MDLLYFIFEGYPQNSISQYEIDEQKVKHAEKLLLQKQYPEVWKIIPVLSNYYKEISQEEITKGAVLISLITLVIYVVKHL